MSNETSSAFEGAAPAASENVENLTPDVSLPEVSANAADESPVAETLGANTAPAAAEDPEPAASADPETSEPSAAASKVAQFGNTLGCEIAEACGGCSWLAVPYAEQLQRKQAKVAELFAPFDVEPEPMCGMEEPAAYRAKVMTPFQPGPQGRLRHGMYAAGTHDLLRCYICPVEDLRARPVLRTIARLCREYRIPAYDEDTRRGLLRHAIVRCAHATDELMVTLVINRKEFPRKHEFVRALRAIHPNIATVVFNVNTRNTNAVLGNSNSVAYGQGWLEDDLCGCTFRIPADAFYQTNPQQTEVLYRKAVELARLRGGEQILDAYCGIGTVGIVAVDVARKTKSAPAGKKKTRKGSKKATSQAAPVRLVGVESVASAVEAAKENARINKVGHAEFICADAGKYLSSCPYDFDVVFLDPPRAGVSPEFIEGLLQSAPKRVVYISCNPETQTRDIQALSSIYRVERVVPVDMFPHTEHVETVALLSRHS